MVNGRIERVSEINILTSGLNAARVLLDNSKSKLLAWIDPKRVVGSDEIYAKKTATFPHYLLYL